ncbi:glycogen synthesis protein GlgS [Salmonella enterica]|uniref:glycogen synthesis protein GlgS n=1 Tax=unclassified Superficieibacter TaxID=2645744 RepID=UPI0012F1CE8E|nr:MULTISPECIES: glycogen synthesis protein GlgS [unclassified Superficieibacter]EAY5055150.1 glycogen synthesis protein GlgS [Salmonella enterica]EBV6452198.1 glycogen synthesis protein GlgS [Salmonella enterica subsp. enterica serovar Ohio]EDV3999020.1 glycogen synthesis protein GlgS [Salmonella enterica subsp. enterica serovar Mbandaka]EEG5919452.1 glycogen synthesis protein GlgS [Salmonella enterica subsp. enterica]EHJ0059698.1 glycogen synthesis protein GlgS [Salmonella enterica]
MPLKSDKCVLFSGDLDFIALSFARMRLLGRQLPTDAITGNMDEDCRMQFLKRYEFYFEQLKTKELAE